jgi:AcrR family transcriptional regulator
MSIPKSKSDHGRSRSRRDRPAKSPLSQGAIVDAALRLVDSEGVDAVTMRRVAQVLDTGPASLYVYIENREQLLNLVLDRVFGEIKLPDAELGDWRTRLHALISSSIEVISRRRGLALVSLATIPTGPNALAVTETMLGLLREGGIDDASSAWGVDLLAVYVTATAAEQSIYHEMLAGSQTEAGLLAQVERAFRSLPADRYPLVLELQPQLLTGSGDERQRWGVDVILNGMLRTPPPIADASTRVPADGSGNRPEQRDGNEDE